jgi:hypothetical protein
MNFPDDYPDWFACYALNGREVLKFKNPIEWAEWHVARGVEAYNVHVADEMVGDVRVSTVLLPSASFSLVGPPKMFETMCFDREGNSIDTMARYSTYDEAEEGHRTIVSSIRMLNDESMQTSQAMLSIIRGGMLINQREKK